MSVLFPFQTDSKDFTSELSARGLNDQAEPSVTAVNTIISKPDTRFPQDTEQLFSTALFVQALFMPGHKNCVNSRCSTTGTILCYRALHFREQLTSVLKGTQISYVFALSLMLWLLAGLFSFSPPPEIAVLHTYFVVLSNSQRLSNTVNNNKQREATKEYSDSHKLKYASYRRKTITTFVAAKWQYFFQVALSHFMLKELLHGLADYKCSRQRPGIHFFMGKVPTLICHFKFALVGNELVQTVCLMESC